MQGHLLSRGIRLQQIRIRESQQLVGTLIIQHLSALNRREYAPLALYYIDGINKVCYLIMHVNYYYLKDGELLYMAVSMDTVAELFILRFVFVMTIIFTQNLTGQTLQINKNEVCVIKNASKFGLGLKRPHKHHTYTFKLQLIQERPFQINMGLRIFTIDHSE